MPIGFFSQGEGKWVHAIYHGRWKEVIFKPLFMLFRMFKLTPNALSFLSLVAAVLVYVFVHDAVLSVIFLISHFVLDLLDGGYARFLGKESDKGTLTDNIVDAMGIVFVSMALVKIGVAADVVVFYTSMYVLLLALLYAMNGMNIRVPFFFRPRLYVYVAFILFQLMGLNVFYWLIVGLSVILSLEVFIAFVMIRKKL